MIIEYYVPIYAVVVPYIIVRNMLITMNEKYENILVYTPLF